ncbi:MAG: TolC family protein [Deltaproteobacteria bacterium]|nr:TolC family protein [Deltaproteobacteria bacterium]
MSWTLRSLVILGLQLGAREAAAAPAAPSAEQTPAEPIPTVPTAHGALVNAAITQAIHRDPAVHAAEAALQAATGAAADAAGLQHNPVVDARLGFGVAQHELALSQPLARGGAGAAARAAAEARRAAAAQRLTLARLDAAAAARAALIEGIAAEQQLKLWTEATALAQAAREGAEARLAAGDGAGLAVQLARLEQAAAEAARLEAASRRAAARRALAACCGISPGLSLPEDPMATAPPPSAARAGLRGTLATAEAGAAAADLRLQQASARPPLAVGLWVQAQDLGAQTGQPAAWAAPMGWSFGPSLELELGLAQRRRAAVGEAGAAARGASAAAKAITDGEAALAEISDQLRDAITRTHAQPMPSAEARGALLALDAAVAAGELSPTEAAPLRQRVLAAWAQAAGLRAAQARATLDLAQAEAWESLDPSGGEP